MKTEQEIKEEAQRLTAQGMKAREGNPAAAVRIMNRLQSLLWVLEITDKEGKLVVEELAYSDAALKFLAALW